MIIKVKLYKFIILLLLAILISPIIQPIPVRAQTGMEGWTTPINLSRSGAASQPRIVASSTGQLQAFWWDQFEGLVTSIYTNSVWGEPRLTTMFGGQLTGSPQIVSDSTGKVHAFWQGAINPTTGAPSLIHSWMAFGSTTWSNPVTVESSTPVYELSIPVTGPLSLALINTTNSIDKPAGVYYHPTGEDGVTFGFPRLVYQSIYYRLIETLTTSLGLASDGADTTQIMWHDPNKVETFYSFSTDRGLTWSETETIGTPEQSPNNPRLAATPNYTLRMWQATALGGCVLYQQRSDSLAAAASATDAAQATEGATASWSAPQRIFEGINFCPQNDRFWVINQGQQLYWLWGQGSNSLGLTTWDDAIGEWSEVARFTFSFEDAESLRLVSLSDLNAAITPDDKLAVIGSDSAGEVWVTLSDLTAQELIVQPPAPWTAPASLSNTGTTPVNITSAMDKDSRLFVVWSQVNDRGAQSMEISRQDTARDPLNVSDSAGFSAELFTARPGELLRQPKMLIDNRDRIQLVWSGGNQGEIQYSWASLQEALSPSGWSTPITLSASGLASSPQIGSDLQGRLYAAFVVPLNEDRGIYLVRSDDAGQTWTAPRQIHDAAGLNWQQVDHLSLAVTSDGSLHVAYVDQGIPGAGVTNGVYYQSSADQGETWTAPTQLAGTGAEWPALAISNGQIHLVYLVTGTPGAYHRWSPISVVGQSDSGWSTPFQIPDWQMPIAGFGLTTDGRPEVSGTLHLVGTATKIGDLLYNTWDGSKWSEMEAFVPFTNASPPVEAGISAATKPVGGELAVTWIASRGTDEDPTLYYTLRSIAIASVPPAPNPVPTQTPEVTVSPTLAAVVVPSPTPILSNTLPSTSPIPATLVGGIIATVVVVSIFIWRLIITQRK